MKNNIVSIVVIADIHLGILDPIYQWENLKENFLKYCIKNKPDIVVIDGDIMDERVSVNNTIASIFHMFIDELIKLDTTILIVEGTKTHDDNQINVFSHRVNDKFRIYKTVTNDYVHGMSILLIPEEYMTNPEDYYKDYLKKEYDFCFGHGMANHIAYVNKKKPIFRKLTSPMWDDERDFKNIIKGRTVFGHVHTHSKNGKFHYVGSFGRYNHGEEEPKGFMHYKYDKSKKQIVSEQFIENTNAKVFKTVVESDLPENRDELMVKLKELSDISFKLRIRLDRDIDELRMSDIMSFCKKKLNVSVDRLFERKKKKQNSNIDMLDGSKKVENKYENMDMIDATIEFILEKHSIKMKKETIIKTLNNDDDHE
ncbi:MAG: hypothetical protein ACOCP4_06415 [Candidatus Woesearchaeota archaeon]